MVRSLSLIHLFIVLSISFIGGALLFREIPFEASENLISFIDSRAKLNGDGSLLRTTLISLLFFVLAFSLSIHRRSRPFVLLIGAVKCVLFGFTSSYLLFSGLHLISYSLWWFPSQLAVHYLFLLFCVVLSPPYFNKKTKHPRDMGIIVVLFGMYMAVKLLEMTIYHFFIQ